MESLMSEKESDTNKKDSSFFDLSEVAKYYFRKKDPNKKKDTNLRMMHGINKIALFMFLAAIIYLVIKRIFLN